MLLNSLSLSCSCSQSRCPDMHRIIKNVAHYTSDAACNAHTSVTMSVFVHRNLTTKTFHESFFTQYTEIIFTIKTFSLRLRTLSLPGIRCNIRNRNYFFPRL